MIIIPKLFNLYSRLDRPTWQQWRDRRLMLLHIVNHPAFWHQPDDQELLALANGPQFMTSMGMWPAGTMAAAAAGQALGTLTLNALVSNNSDDVGTVDAGIRFVQAGNVQEQNAAGSYVSQNPTVEWTDETGTPGDLAEAKLDTTTGTAPTFTGGWSENVYDTIDNNLTASHSRSTNGTTNGQGTAYVREIANTANNVTASFQIRVQKFDTILL